MQYKLKIGALVFLSLLSLFSCDKKDKKTPKQYSTWIVNGIDTFSTNEVDTEIACNPDKTYCIADLRSHGPDRFNLGFYLDYYPKSGNWPMSSVSSQGPAYAYLGLYYKNQLYIPAAMALDTIYVGSINSKPSYNLNPAWYVNKEDNTDSIQIQGVFNIP